MSERNPDDWFRDPNDDAYEKLQERTGLPLEYVAEKLRNSVAAIHQVLAAAEDTDANDPAKAESLRLLRLNSSLAFRYGVTSYLALMNMLALANDKDVFERLANYSKEEFK